MEVQDDLYDKNLYNYCDNNPIVRVDENGALWELAVVGGETLAVDGGLMLGTWVAGLSNAWNAIGWIALGIAVIATTVYLGCELYQDIRSKKVDEDSIAYAKSKPRTGINPVGGHTKGKSKGKKNKHENGDARRKKDQGGSKARNNGNFKSKNNKRRNGRERLY